MFKTNLEEEINHVKELLCTHLDMTVEKLM